MISSGLTNPHAVKSDPAKLHITFVDVGQGDSTLIRLPQDNTHNTRAILIDCPSGESTTILKHIQAQRINRLELIVVTHSDDDHCGGIADLLEAFLNAPQAMAQPNTIGEIAYLPEMMVPVGRQMSTSLKRFLSYIIGLEERGLCILFEPRLDTRSYTSGVLISFLHPAPRDRIIGQLDADRNGPSQVVLMEFEHIHVLFTADITEKGWHSLVRRHAATPLESGTTVSSALHAQILKFPHHGGGWRHIKAMIEMFELVQPEYVIISTGTTNPYKHPVQQVFDALKKSSSVKRILCTQATAKRCGATTGRPFPCAGSIEFIITPENLQVAPSEAVHHKRIQQLQERRPACLNWLPVGWDLDTP